MHGNRPFPVVSVFDPALDHEAMGGLDKVVKYQKDRDPDLPKARPGMKLAWFTTHRLSEDDMEYCEQAPSENKRAIRAFQYGVSQIENAPTTDGKTEPLLTPGGSRERNGTETHYWTDGQLPKISRAMRIEIGAVVWARSFLAHESAPPCLLPRSLVDDFHMALRRLVEDSPTRDSDPSSEKPPSSSEPTTSPDDD